MHHQLLLITATISSIFVHVWKYVCSNYIRVMFERIVMWYDVHRMLLCCRWEFNEFVQWVIDWLLCLIHFLDCLLLINQLWRLEKEAEHINLLEVLIHLEAYDDMEDKYTLTVVVHDFLLKWGVTMWLHHILWLLCSYCQVEYESIRVNTMLNARMIMYIYIPFNY